MGAKNLAIAVIKSGIHIKDGKVKYIDEKFFESEMFDFWASLAYGCKPDYIDGVCVSDIVVRNVNTNNKPSARERCSRKG